LVGGLLRCCGTAKHDIHLPSPAAAVGLGGFRADNHVGETVAVEVAGAAHRTAGHVVVQYAAQHVTVRAVESRQVEGRVELTGSAEEHVSCAAAGNRVGLRVRSAQDHIGKT